MQDWTLAFFGSRGMIVHRPSRAVPPSIGPFRLIAPLGQGGFAPVWRAEEVYEGRKLRDVAVKLFFLPDGVEPSSAKAARWHDRVVDEASALCRVEHSNVVRFIRLQPDDARSIVALVMEYVAGKNLGAILRERGSLAETELLDIGIAVAWALAAVHESGLVHRDIKPENIIRGAAGYKLIDFGIVASTANEAGLDGLRPPPLFGTPPYVAPEYVEHRALPSPTGDMYALGVTLFKLMTGALPEGRSGRASRSGAELYTRAPAATLRQLIDVLLDPDPRTRPRHADWVARELERLRDQVAASPASRHGQGTARRGLVRGMNIERLLALSRQAPDAIVPLFKEIRRVCEDEGAGEASHLIRELGVAVVRYTFARGMALLAAAPSIRLTTGLERQLREAAQLAHSSWFSLLRALCDTLHSVDSASGRLFGFVTDPSLADRFDALLGDRGAAPEAWERWIASFFEKGAAVLAPPRSHATNAGVGDCEIALEPWLVIEAGRPFMPDLPVAPGSPWCLVDPISGQRREDERLDQAICRLLREDEGSRKAAVEPNLRPPFVGRARELAILERAALEARQGGVRFVVITGPLGVGRTRLLDEAIEHAGFGSERTFRGYASPERQGPLHPLAHGENEFNFELFFRVKGAIDRALSDPAPLATKGGDNAHELVEQALLAISAEKPVLFAIDDVQWADERTLQLLRLLLERADSGAKAKLLVLATARDEPHASAPLRTFLGAVQGRARRAVRHLALGPLTSEDAETVVRGVCPVHRTVQRAVVRGAGGLPFFLIHALASWHVTGALVWRDGAFFAASDRALDDVPGVAALVEARLATYFVPESPAWRAALRVLAAVALCGHTLGVCGDEQSVSSALDALASAGILVASGESRGYRFAQEMVRQSVLNHVRQRSWFHGLHRALLDSLSAQDWRFRMASPQFWNQTVAFLADGYDQLGDSDKAKLWLGRAMEMRLGSGLIAEAVVFGDRLAAIASDPGARAEAEIATVRALVRGRHLDEAKKRLDRRERGGHEVRWRIVRLEVARARREPADDAELLRDVDALSDPLIACEARMALAGVAPQAEAMPLIGEAIEIAERLGPAIEFSARLLRAELIFAADICDPGLAERDLRRALSLAREGHWTGSQLQIEGNLAVLEGERGHLSVAIEWLERLVHQAEAMGMKDELRTLLHKLSTFLMRDKDFYHAAMRAREAERSSKEAGDPVLEAEALYSKAWALFEMSDLPDSLVALEQAHQLQRDRDDPNLAHTLLLRAIILKVMGNEEDAQIAAQTARDVATRHGNKSFHDIALARWQIQLAMRGIVSANDLRETLSAVAGLAERRIGVTWYMLKRARAWLATVTPRWSCLDGGEPASRSETAAEDSATPLLDDAYSQAVDGFQICASLETGYCNAAPRTSAEVQLTPCGSPRPDARG